MKTLLLLVALGKAADMSSTAAVLNQGGRELNPALSSHTSVMLTQQAAWTAGELFIIHKLSRRHPKWARAIGYVSIAGSVYGTAVNLRAYGPSLPAPATTQWCDGVHITC